jgi:ferric-dicitrate binding protein FerR (iron transport regulator)
VISLTLADGTQIWLNAASSITYPTAFAGAERKVKVSGEAYFKVVHNNKMPFKVAIDNIEVTDLGTEFNIRAYDDEKEIQTTLVEGSVKVSRFTNTSPKAGNESVFVKPGEQAVVAENAAINITHPDVLDEITAWREGLFHFESTELPVILKEFSRWYDIDVAYSGKIPTDKYFLIFKRSSSLVTVLEALKAGGVKFQVEGRKLIVQPG